MVNPVNTDLYAKSITLLLEKFNKIIKKIIEGLNNNKIDPLIIAKLRTAMEDFIIFSRNKTFPLIFAYIHNNEEIMKKLSKDFTEIKYMTLQIFDKIEEQFNEYDKTEKIDIDKLKNYVEFIGAIMDNFTYITIETIRYSKGKITEEEYDKNYLDFKNKLIENKKIFDNLK